MSYFDRAGKNANSAVLVSVAPEDFGGGPLGGAEFIHRLEEKAYQLGRGGKAPTALTREFEVAPVSYTHLDVYKRQLVARVEQSVGYPDNL